MLITDGYSNNDTGIKGGYTNTKDDRLDIGDHSQRNNSIFLQDNYMHGVPIQDYITRNSTPGDPNSLGAQLSTFVNTQSLSSASFSESAKTWSKIETGSPTVFSGLNHSSLGVNQQLTKTVGQALKSVGVSYVSGYNANDPSRPFPPLRFSGNSVTLGHQGYIKDTQIYQANVYDGNFFSDYLDDVTAFLRYEDLRPDMGTGTKYEKQFVKTYVVGYMFSNDLLKRAAIMGGTGENGYMTANNYDELKLAFSTIINSIKEEMSVFASPALPASGDNELYTGKSCTWACSSRLPVFGLAT